MTTKVRKIGVMGGTFDPIHIGHLVIAEAVRTEFGLEKVLFVPANHPPHKQAQNVTSALHRYVMTVLATASNPFFFVSPIEIHRPGPSYTVDTLRQLRKEIGEPVELYFITGVDTIRELPTWERIEELFELCHFVGASRPGCEDAMEATQRYFGTVGQGRIHRLTTPELAISSTDIRLRAQQGRSIQYIVPEMVEQYILKEGLYLGLADEETGSNGC